MYVSTYPDAKVSFAAGAVEGAPTFFARFDDGDINVSMHLGEWQSLDQRDIEIGVNNISRVFAIGHVDQDTCTRLSRKLSTSGLLATLMFVPYGSKSEQSLWFRIFSSDP